MKATDERPFRRRNRGRRRLSSIKAAFFGLVFSILTVLPVLFSSCDLLGGSVAEYIDENTGDVKVTSWNITSTEEISKLRGGGTWMHNPIAGEGGEYIEYTVVLDNPRNYDLKVTPVIYEYIGPDGKSVSNPAQKEIDAQKVGNTVKIRIDEPVRGDSFRVRLDMATADGVRVFSSFSDMARIVYDKPLLPATGVGVTGTAQAPRAQWNIPDSNSHEYVNRITLKFTKNNDPTSQWERGPWVYEKKGETWELVSGNAPPDSRELSGTTTLSVPFPLEGNVSERSEVEDNYNFIVVLEDKNGIRSESKLHGINEFLKLENLEVFYRVTGSGEYRSPDFVFDPEKSSYRLIVPYEVSALRFDTVASSEYQTVTKPAGGIPLIGKNTMAIHVSYTDPITKDVIDPLPYEFEILRLSPNRDSTLKNISVRNLDTFFNLLPVFEENYQGDVETQYTVHVPSTVNSIDILCDYLETSAIYNDRGISDGKPNRNGGQSELIDSIANPGYRGFMEDQSEMDALTDMNEYDWCYRADTQTRWDYKNGQWIDSGFSYSGINYEGTEYSLPEYDGLKDQLDESHPLEIRRSGWTYYNDQNKLPYGETRFYINVKPQEEGTQVRMYTIRVIKALPNDNPAARLAELTVSAGDNLLLGTAHADNRFEPGLRTYTVNVPHGTGSVTIAAEGVQSAGYGQARIGEISSEQPASYIPGPVVTTTISGIGQGTTRRVTLKVLGGPAGSTPNSYDIHINGCLPALSTPPELKGGNESLHVAWSNGVSTAAYYEVRYSPDAGGEQSPEVALRWAQDIPASSPATTITGLGNNSKYKVWVRARNSAGVPGEWKQARTMPNSGQPVPYGTPGTAELSNLNVESVSGAAIPANSLVPVVSGGYTHELIVPSGTEQLKFTASKPVGSNQTGLGQSVAISPGETKDHSITSVSPDGKTPKTYKIKITRRLAAPGGFEIDEAGDGAVILNWSAVSGNTYELYYWMSGGAITGENFESTAPRELGISGGSITVSALVNHQSYNFRLRAVKDGTPGDWAPLSAMPKSKNSSLKPGSGITVTKGTLVPAFTPETLDYKVILPPGNDSVTITAARGEAYQTLGISEEPSGSVAVDSVTVTPSPGAGVKAVITVTPDNPGGPAKTYTVTAYRTPASPGALTLVPQNNKISVNWSSVTGADLYEVFYCRAQGNNINVPTDEMKIQTVPSNTDTYEIAGLLNNVPYHVWVRAVDTYEAGVTIAGEFSARGTVTPANVYLFATKWTESNVTVESRVGSEERTTASPGEIVTVTIESDYGLKPGTFKVWKGTEQISHTGSGHIFTFTMPEGNVSYDAEFFTGHLSDLRVQWPAQLSFEPSLFVYSIPVPNSVTALQVTGISNEGATVIVGANTLSVDEPTTIPVTVKPAQELGATQERVYTITVKREKPNTLEDLTLKYTTTTIINDPPGSVLDDVLLDLTPAFSGNNPSYMVLGEIPSDVTTITIGWEKTNSESVVSISGGTVTNETVDPATAVVILPAEPEYLTVQVTVRLEINSGFTEEKTYTVFIHRNDDE